MWLFDVIVAAFLGGMAYAAAGRLLSKRVKSFERPSTQNADHSAGERVSLYAALAAAREVESDPAGLSRQTWFPAGRDPEPERISELRSAPRFPFPHLQAVALAADEMAVENLQFMDVQFRDISTKGFSFYAPQQLECERLIARLGFKADTVLVTARVVHQTDVPASTGHVVRVGCQILGRVECPFFY
jgi:hypothetical protein